MHKDDQAPSQKITSEYLDNAGPFRVAIDWLAALDKRSFYPAYR